MAQLITYNSVSVCPLRGGTKNLKVFYSKHILTSNSILLSVRLQLYIIVQGNQFFYTVQGKSYEGTIFYTVWGNHTNKKTINTVWGNHRIKNRRSTIKLIFQITILIRLIILIPWGDNIIKSVYYISFMNL